jgi:hypothetical protein
VTRTQCADRAVSCNLLGEFSISIDRFHTRCADHTTTITTSTDNSEWKQQPWTWSEEIVRVCWCKNAGIPEHRWAFEGIDGKGLIKEIDETWMKMRGIPHGLAVTVFEQHIKRLRQMTQDAGIITRLWWWI